MECVIPKFNCKPLSVTRIPSITSALNACKMKWALKHELKEHDKISVTLALPKFLFVFLLS